MIPSDYPNLLVEIKERIRSAQYAALKAVNKELIGLYWDIGRMIVERQQGGTWGKAIVEQLARDLHAEFPGIQGLSARNIRYMRELWLTYHDNRKLQPLVAEIGWTHNLIIMEKCKDDLEREFYIRMTRKYGSTKAVLIHQIEGRTYEKTLLSQTNFDRTLPEAVQAQAKLAVKDEYTFDIPCKTKDKTIVEYALRESNKPIGVASYRMTAALPQALRDELPSPEQIARLLEGID